MTASPAPLPGTAGVPPALTLLICTVLSAFLPATAADLHFTITAPPEPALIHPQKCDPADIPDAPARAIRTATGQVLLFAASEDNRVNTGPDLLHLTHPCPVILRGAQNDDPAAFDDHAWITTPWSPDGRTIHAVIHNEFHGHTRPALCPSRTYMLCWSNALTAATSTNSGQTFTRIPTPALIAALPYRYDQLGPGHHGYFNPSNIVTLDTYEYMFAFATKAGAQREGNCLLRTGNLADPTAWRAWSGTSFDTAFIDPYTTPTPTPERHVCAPVDPEKLRWPLTSLVRHAPTGRFIALMQNTGPNGAIYAATSPDLLTWSPPTPVMPATGLPSYACGQPPPLAYPSLLDPLSPDRNFETIGDTPHLFATRFDLTDCHPTMTRTLLRWPIRITAGPP